MNFLSNTLAWRFRDEILSGLEVTLVISIASVIIGSILGLIIALMHMSHHKTIRAVAGTYVEILRGTPMIVQLEFVYFSLPLILGAILSVTGIHIQPNIATIPAGIIAVSINSSAYVSEAIRGGFNSVNIGQTEAARSLGLSQRTTMRFVVIPQALKNIWPALGNEFVALIKESSIVLIIGAPDIMYQINNMRATTFNGVTPLIIAAAIYFILTFSLSRIMKHFERKMKHD
ncbi:amino acid ABC transporter permease [Oenococcus kitaharae]|uniref:ABC-type amino acid transport system, permease and periplasmic component n=1 Tax=Oenococcus kitaharae DSM 17330 TaxID=1045004 RepID=G9WGR9_9LACO|nr:amino acid ABC transporter permease [Oenococcus kitaharae]EHN59896.1 ABC-type amino acid transport system, permease and periplasmic component [Oenococcus kitaharae DSM 17330]MCV3296659.1 amino acid ABC transporter permease [Oenococcus kitaharae]